jgi:cell division septation protein DedD
MRKSWGTSAEEMSLLVNQLFARLEDSKMTKTAVIALFAFAMLPFSACSSNSDQAAYMSNSNAEQNAREAEQAEEEFAQLASKEAETPKAKTKVKATEHKVAEHKTEKKAEKKAEKKLEHKVAEQKTVEHREPASAHETKHSAIQSQRVYTVQLGAFRVKENAAKLTQKLKGAGFPVLMVNKDGSKSGDLYLVHLEPTPNKNEAEKWQSDLKLKSFDSTLTSKRD